jgi:hypothetical protein
MPCIEQRIPGGVAIYCTRGRGGRRAACYACKAPHTALCDWPMPKGGTCDQRLCERHRARQGGDVDYCPAHAVKAAQGVPS